MTIAIKSINFAKEIIALININDMQSHTFIVLWLCLYLFHGEFMTVLCSSYCCFSLHPVDSFANAFNRTIIRFVLFYKCKLEIASRDSLYEYFLKLPSCVINAQRT